MNNLNSCVTTQSVMDETMKMPLENILTNIFCYNCTSKSIKSFKYQGNLIYSSKYIENNPFCRRNHYHQLFTQKQFSTEYYKYANSIYLSSFLLNPTAFIEENNFSVAFIETICSLLSKKRPSNSFKRITKFVFSKLQFHLHTKRRTKSFSNVVNYS